MDKNYPTRGDDNATGMNRWSLTYPKSVQYLKVIFRFPNPTYWVYPIHFAT